MFTKKENSFVDGLARWAESIGIRLDRDQEQAQILDISFSELETLGDVS